MTNTIAVSFHSTELYIVNHNGEPYTPMRPIIEGMGMTWAAQFVKIKNRFATCVAEIAMQLPGDKQRRKVTCLPLRKLAGWFQTISPNKVRPEIRERVIQYQEECDDVLYEYWTKGQAVNPRMAQAKPAKFILTIFPDGTTDTQPVTGDTIIADARAMLGELRERGWIVIRRDMLAQKLALL